MIECSLPWLPRSVFSACAWCHSNPCVQQQRGIVDSGGILGYLKYPSFGCVPWHRESFSYPTFFRTLFIVVMIVHDNLRRRWLTVLSIGVLVWAFRLITLHAALSVPLIISFPQTTILYQTSLIIFLLIGFICLEQNLSWHKTLPYTHVFIQLTCTCRCCTPEWLLAALIQQ